MLNISENRPITPNMWRKMLRNAGVRAEADLRNEKITYKIREHSLNRLPYQLLSSATRKKAGLVAVRIAVVRTSGRCPSRF